MEDDDRVKIQRIYDIYGQGVLCPVAERQSFPRMEAWLAGLMMRETEGGLSPLLVDVCNTPDIPDDDVGDSGHGHGIFQIDDRWYPDFCLSESWKDPYESAYFVSNILDERDTTLRTLSFRLHLAIPDLERAIIASYNAGSGAVLKAIRGGYDVDLVTTGRNYSRRVLQYAAIYEQILGSQKTKSVSPTFVATFGISLSGK